MVSFIDLITWFRLTLPVAFVFALLDIVCYLLEFIVVSMFQMHGFFITCLADIPVDTTYF